jgi:hypothetical protein
MERENRGMCVCVCVCVYGYGWMAGAGVRAWYQPVVPRARERLVLDC